MKKKGSQQRQQEFHKKFAIIIWDTGIGTCKSLLSAQATCMVGSRTTLLEIREKTCHDVAELAQVPVPPSPNTNLQDVKLFSIYETKQL